MNTLSASDKKRTALVLLPMLLLGGTQINTSVYAFQASITSPIRSNSHLKAAPLHELPLTQMDPHELSVHAHAVQGFLQHHTSLMVSDAATATALDNFEATEAAIVADEGWWQAYLNVFKTTIIAIHSGIDGPIHKLGWEGGTWGFSIALFTAGKLIFAYGFLFWQHTLLFRASFVQIF